MKKRKFPVLWKTRDSTRNFPTGADSSYEGVKIR